MAITNSLNLTVTNLVRHDGSGSFVGREITVGSALLTIANGDGQAGNPSIDADESAFTLDNIGGTLSPSKGGTGQTTYTDGQLLIGNSTGNTLVKASLTAGDGITITPGSGSITIDAAVTGSGTYTDETIIRGDGGTTGIQDSSVTIDDSNVVSSVTQLDVDNLRLDGNTIISTDTNGDITLQPASGSDINLSPQSVTQDLSSSNTTVYRLVSNTDNTSSAADGAMLDLRYKDTDAAFAGVRFSRATTRSFAIGLDNNANDALKITTTADNTATPVTGTDLWIMTTDGIRTMPLQPAFLGTLNSDDANATGDGTTYVLGTVTALTETFDQGGDFTTAGVFTAPVTGAYFINYCFNWGGAGAGTRGANRCSTSNGLWVGGVYSASNYDDATASAAAFTMDILVDMDAADTALAVIVGDNGTKIEDIQGNGTTAETWMSGYLVG